MNVLKKHRGLVLQLIDLCLWMLGAAAAMVLSDAMALLRVQVFAVVAAVHILVYQFLGMYRVIWRYAGIRQFARCIVCEAAAYVMLDLGGALFFHWRINRFAVTGVACTALLVMSSRLAYAALVSYLRGGIRPVAQTGIRTLIIGAGNAACILLEDMQRDKAHTYAPVGLVDDDPAKQGRRLWNVKVYGPIDELRRFARQLDAQLIVFAIFDIRPERKRAIMELCASTGIKVLMVPSPKELHEVTEGVSQRLRDVDINDLLGREPVLLDKSEAQDFIQNRRVLVTGGGGSIGSELCRQIAAMRPSKTAFGSGCAARARERPSGTAITPARATRSAASTQTGAAASRTTPPTSMRCSMATAQAAGGTTIPPPTATSAATSSSIPPMAAIRPQIPWRMTMKR